MDEALTHGGIANNLKVNLVRIESDFLKPSEIEKIVAGERKKLSDQKISDLLNKRGFNLARRTISKYRKKRN